MGQLNQMIMSHGTEYYRKPLSCFSHKNKGSCLEELVVSRGDMMGKTPISTPCITTHNQLSNVESLKHLI